jgi:YidC/Oxa1 family membrane protein insertase
VFAFLDPIWKNGLLVWIFSALQWLYTNVTHDYGFAIILLTLGFRLLLTPLTWKQTKSMYELQEIQPKIKALQEKYKNNKEKQQEEMMKFYQENKVNPFGGCLPLILQMPLFIALFSVLRENLAQHIATLPATAQAAAKTFWVIIPDITMSPQQVYQVASTVPTHTVAPGASLVATSAVVAGSGGVVHGVIAALPYFVFVILFGLSVWLPQYLMTKDPTQRRTGTYMALMMLYFGFITPAGVLIYWVTSSAWQVVQQIFTQRVLAKAKEEAEAALPPAAKGKGGKSAAAESSSSEAPETGPKPKSGKTGKSGGKGSGGGKSKGKSSK